MEEITVSAKTLDDAITEALIQLGVTSDQLEYDVIEKRKCRIPWYWKKAGSYQSKTKS